MVEPVLNLVNSVIVLREVTAETSTGPVNLIRVQFITMAKISKNQRSSIPPLSSRSSKSRRRPNRFRNPAKSDVYEYQSHKVRRAYIPLSLDKDETREHGAASDDDSATDVRKPRLIGESVEDEDVPSEDDEELDSDAAFEDADEERFAGFSFPNVRTLIRFFSYVALSVREISLAARRRVKNRPIRQKLTSTM